MLLHEFGHALACRQVGGVANRIVLWPLGGIAYVNPPPRPGAVLWSIAAGPLVNVALVPITLGLYVWSGMGGHDAGDLPGYLQAIYFINLKDGDAVMSPFKVQFGLTGMGGTHPVRTTG